MKWKRTTTTTSRAAIFTVLATQSSSVTAFSLTGSPSWASKMNHPQLAIARSYSSLTVDRPTNYLLPSYKYTNSVSRSFAASFSTEARTPSSVSSSEDLPDTEVSEVNVLANGKILSTGHFSNAGLTVIRINNDDFVNVTEHPKVGNLDKKIEPSIMGSPLSTLPSKLSTSSTPSGAGDLVGHECILPNGNIGIIVAHRPPLAFVYSHSALSNTTTTTTPDEYSTRLDSSPQAKSTDTQTTTDTVQVMDSLASILMNQDVNNNNNNNNNVEHVFEYAAPFVVNDTDGRQRHPIHGPIPLVSDIALINSPLVTGITMFDALTPIGKGQNMLMIGHNRDEMRHYVCNILQSIVQQQQQQLRSGSANKPTKCIYASNSDSRQVQQMLVDMGLSKDVLFLDGSCTGASDNSDSYDPISAAARSILTTATACTIAETLAHEQGMDTLVVVDTIEPYKKLWDATTRVLVQEFGERAVVKGDIHGSASGEFRGFLSNLVQRSAQYNKDKGGGSVTLLLLTTIPKLPSSSEESEMVFSKDDFANCSEKIKERIRLLIQRNIPLTATNLKKIQIPLPIRNNDNNNNNSNSEQELQLALQHVDDLISMSDGQIFFWQTLEEGGQRPAMDVARSVTRIGIGAETQSRADAPAMRRVVEGLRLDLSQALDAHGPDAKSELSQKEHRKALAWHLAMHQPSNYPPRRLSESCTALLAASKGYLDGCIRKGAVAGTSMGEEIMTNLLLFVQTHAPKAMDDIDATLDMTKETREEIELAIQQYFSSLQ